MLFVQVEVFELLHMQPRMATCLRQLINPIASNTHVADVPNSVFGENLRLN